MRSTRFFADLLTRKRTLPWYALVIILPLLVFLLLLYRNVSRNIESIVTFSARQSVEQSAAFVSKAFQDAINVSDALIMSKTFQDVFTRNTPSSDVFGQMKDYLDLVGLQYSFSTLSGIARIRFYLPDTAIYLNGDDFLSFSAARESAWYSKLQSSDANSCWVHFAASEEPPASPAAISLVRFILDPNNYQRQVGILRVDLQESGMQSILTKVAPTKSSVAFLLDSRNEIFSSSVTQIRKGWILQHGAYTTLADESGKHFGTAQLEGERVCLGCQVIGGTDLALVSVTPYGEILGASRRIRNNIALLLAVVMSAAASIFAFVLLSSMVKRRTYELKALQGQINPHFLYNTLDLINWTAINSQVPEISNLVQLLSRFYKLSLRGGADIVTVGEELEHVRLYVEIQNRRFDGAFRLLMDVEDEVNDYSTLKIILQPILENAIVHGILKKESKRGTIILSARLREGKIVFTIRDDGVGMTPEELKTVLSIAASDGHGYGVRNIDERIRLMYGRRYGLSFSSEPGSGTCVMIAIPALRRT